MSDEDEEEEDGFDNVIVQEAIDTSNSRSDQDILKCYPTFHYTPPTESEEHKEFLSTLFSLTKSNMEGIYGPGNWKDGEVLKEIGLPDSRYLVYYSGNPIKREVGGFLQFQFSEDYEDHAGGMVPCLYIYQLQLSPTEQGKRLGLKFMSIVEDFSRKYKILRLKLTCFKKNQRALDWYKGKLGFSLDNTDPSFYGNPTVDYWILSKQLSPA